jgi:putative flippase GtrA
MTASSLTRPGAPAYARTHAGWAAQLSRFAVVGGSAGLVQLALYAFLADSIGSQPANVGSWLASTVLATEAHRRFSFRSGAAPGHGDHTVGVLTSALTLALGTAALAALSDPTGTAGVLALVAVNGAVGALRFVALRWWLVGRRHRGGVSQAMPSPSPSMPVE